MFRLREFLARFMYGRNGLDQFSLALLITYSVFALVNVFARTLIISVLALGIAFYTLYRILSRNIIKRQSENRWFLGIWGKAKKSLLIRRISEIRTRRFRTCKNCKTVLRLPIKSGKHNVTCPKCKHNFMVRILF